jgi:hypothetical protein
MAGLRNPATCDGSEQPATLAAAPKSTAQRQLRQTAKPVDFRAN